MALIGIPDHKSRVITAAGDVTATFADYYLIIKKTIGESTTIYLPPIPSVNQVIDVKDGKGDADTHNITINGNGKTIDGGSTLVIGSPYGWNSLVWNGTQWNIWG